MENLTEEEILNTHSQIGTLWGTVKKLNTSYKIVKECLEKHRVKLKFIKISEEKKKLFIKLANEGFTLTEISKTTNYAYFTISRILKQELGEQYESIKIRTTPTQETIDEVVKNYACLQSIAKVSEKTTLNEYIISKILRSNGICTKRKIKEKKIKSKRKIIKIDDEFKSKLSTLYAKYGNCTDVAKELNISNTSVRNKLKMLNIPMAESRKLKNNRRYKSKYQLNEEYFENIDNQDKAYILGFLYADGYNSPTGSVQVALQQQDVSILEYIAKQLEFTGKVRNNQHGPYCRISIASRKLSTDLSAKGCTPAKSFTIRFPDFITEHLVRHFIRGYFDGDGSAQNAKTSRTTTISFIGNIEFLSGLNKYLSETLGMEIRHIRKYEKCKNLIGELRYSRREVIAKLNKFMYEDANFYLIRKYNKVNYYNDNI